MDTSASGWNGNPLRSILLLYLRRRREDVVRRLRGLGEYDIRRPLVPSGTNLLGLPALVAPSADCSARRALPLSAPPE